MIIDGKKIAAEIRAEAAAAAAELSRAGAPPGLAVVLVGDCADCFSPKTVRATMGAIFRQRVMTLSLEQLPAFLHRHGLALYGAALSERASDVRKVDITHSAVAVGSEGHGLSRELLALCDGEIIIPMDARSESLNAAVAASVLMWEMARGN